jgi:putative flippase GtrA
MLTKYFFHKNKRVFKFLIVGIVSSLFNLLVFYILFYQFKLNDLVSYSVAYIFGVLIGFFLNKNWSFNNQDKNWKPLLIRYFLVYTFNLFFGMLCFKVLNTIFSYEDIIIQIFVIGITATCNYLGLKTIVFKKP